ncbi:hypothetical protein [Endozoicomonas arenosclerae]|uniref:hypothetical protein n=1 Tax=Endozoicomonas arenosclerae TaxID=1633495 RepID=UPI000781FE44|nr:hypothetical protein [Endozoicomonas arenosclerae]
MRRSLLAGAVPVVVVLAMLQGCSKPQDCPKVAPSATESVSPVAEAESYDCTSVDSSDAMKQVWCEARGAFDQSSVADDVANFDTYLKGYRQGINDARRAETSQVSREVLEGQTEKPDEAGYRAGYQRVVEELGILEYNCSDSEKASEYKDRWCEADDAYRIAGVGSSDNPFIRGRFIDGYMAGGRVALTVPTSMEAFFSGENPEGKQPAIYKREGDDVKPTEQAFYRGFDEGYKAMIASIRESINQVMQQMQVPNNMQMPEGLMPPQPGQ